MPSSNENDSDQPVLARTAPPDSNPGTAVDAGAAPCRLRLRPPQKVTIPAGTQLTVRLNEPLDSERNQVGDQFHGSLGAPIVVDDQTVIPIGTDVTGRVAAVQSAGRFAGNSLLTLELTSLSVNGKTYNVQTNQWSRQGKGEGKNTAVKAGGGAALGAIIGGLASGGRGAAIGAAAGGAAGTGVAATKKGEQIKLGPEATLNFQLINALTVTPQSSNDRDAGRTPMGVARLKFTGRSHNLTAPFWLLHNEGRVEPSPLRSCPKSLLSSTLTTTLCALDARWIHCVPATRC